MMNVMMMMMRTMRMTTMTTTAKMRTSSQSHGIHSLLEARKTWRGRWWLVRSHLVFVVVVVVVVPLEINEWRRRSVTIPSPLILLLLLSPGHSSLILQYCQKGTETDFLTVLCREG